MIAFPEDFPVSEGGNSQEADAAHPSHASASPAAQQENRAPESTQQPATAKPVDCELSRCEQCEQCRKFTSGDFVELSPEGIVALSRRIFSFGCVLGQARIDSGLRIKVHWDGLPSMLISMMFPRHIQKRFEEGKAFL